MRGKSRLLGTLLALFLGLGLSDDGATAPLRITFINPGISNPDDPTGGFWLSVSAFMRAAAEDFGIDLEILYAERDHIRMKRQAEEVAKRADKPDYLIVVNEKLAADAMVEAANEAGIRTFLLLNGFNEEQAKAMGKPRELFPHWIGVLTPDNEKAGYLIAQHLIEQAQARNLAASDGRLHLGALGGDASTPASVLRNAGLERALREHPGTVLDRLVYAEWRRDTAKEKLRFLLDRYPAMGAVWCANDPIALGALEAVREAGRKPGEDLFVGGLNWDAPALEEVRNGSLAVSVGGHFMAGGWAVVMLYDYHHGRDFLGEETRVKGEIFNAITKDNVEDWMAKFGDRDWSRIDFTRFSKTRNPAIETYDFTLQALLSQEGLR